MQISSVFLPQELIRNILSDPNLEPKDFGSCNLVCRLWNCTIRDFPQYQLKHFQSWVLKLEKEEASYSLCKQIAKVWLDICGKYNFTNLHDKDISTQFTQFKKEVNDLRFLFLDFLVAKFDVADPAKVEKWKGRALPSIITSMNDDHDPVPRVCDLKKRILKVDEVAKEYSKILLYSRDETEPSIDHQMMDALINNKNNYSIWTFSDSVYKEQNYIRLLNYDFEDGYVTSEINLADTTSPYYSLTSLFERTHASNRRLRKGVSYQEGKKRKLF